MKLWTCVLTGVCIALAALYLDQIHVIRDLEKKHESSQRVNANLVLMVSVHMREQQELNREYDRMCDLVLRHNRTLIHNLKTGKLESDGPKVAVPNFVTGSKVPGEADR